MAAPSSLVFFLVMPLATSRPLLVFSFFVSFCRGAADDFRVSRFFFVENLLFWRCCLMGLQAGSFSLRPRKGDRPGFRLFGYGPGPALLRCGRPGVGD